MFTIGFCFVTGHLAAGFANFEERNRDYWTINNGLIFQRSRSIEDHDAIVSPVPSVPCPCGITHVLLRHAWFA